MRSLNWYCSRASGMSFGSALAQEREQRLGTVAAADRGRECSRHTGARRSALCLEPACAALQGTRAGNAVQQGGAPKQ